MVLGKMVLGTMLVAGLLLHPPPFLTASLAVATTQTAAGGQTAQSPAGPHGHLTVESLPAGARVFLDGIPVGTTPLEVSDVPAGRYALRIELFGYRPWARSILIVENALTPVRAALESATALPVPAAPSRAIPPGAEAPRAPTLSAPPRPAPAQPAAPLTVVTPRDESQALKAVTGAGIVLSFPQPTERIAIADDTIARLTVVSPREVVVTGLVPGRTTLAAWFPSGRRVLYRLVVEPNLEPARAALRELDTRLVLELGADGRTVVLRGDVADEARARQARSIAERLIPSGTEKEPLTLVNLVRYPGFAGSAEERLAAAMATIDSRIVVRRIQSNAGGEGARDSYILEGKVRDVNALVQAVVLADRQLGGNGKTVKAADAERVSFTRNAGGFSLGTGGGGGGGGGGAQALQGGQPPESGIAAQLARGLLVTSESGLVVSFLEVDELPQIMVAIRVLQIDRNKARRLGLDFNFDASRPSGSNLMVSTSNLSSLRPPTDTPVAGGTYVSNTLAIMAAIDLLTDKLAARSVAEPNVLTLSGEQATVLVGGEVPIPTAIANQVATQSSFGFQQFGVRLDIRPTLDRSGMVTLEVAPSIVTPVAALGNGTVPGFRIQRVETTARVQAGESLVLGGLLSSSESVRERGIPGLSKLPIFRWQQTNSEDTELLFLITPRVVQPPSGEIALPPLEFGKGSTTTGLSGLDASGVPSSFRPQNAIVRGKRDACVEVREQPTTDSLVIDCAPGASSVVMLATAGRWTKIRLQSGREGWALTDRLLRIPLT